ncbi:MAG: efflux RND transporter permease subunit [Labedaea sp.]
MIRGIVSLSLMFRVLVIGAAAAIFVLGLAQLPSVSMDVYPEFGPPQVQIQAEALGLSAAEVEQLITVPIEQDLLNGVAWLDQIRSESAPGLSSIDLTFKPGTDLLQARQAVQERLTQAHALPNVGGGPVMLQSTSSAGRVMMIGLKAKDLSLIDLSVLARWKIRPKLMGVPGVANVAIWGQRDRQLQVQVDPGKLRDSGVSLTQVLTTTGNALWVSSLSFVEASTPGTGGFVDMPSQRLSIQHVLPITTAQDLSAVTVEDLQDSRKLKLGDVATVVEDHQPLIGDTVLDSEQGLMLVVDKAPGADTVGVTNAVEDALDELRPGLSGVRIDTTVQRPATFIATALHNLGRWALLGLVGILLMLGVALFSLRAALIGFVAITLSLVTAMYVLYLRGVTFNLLILAGLVVALGLVIDDAVVDVDAIRRRLREHRDSGSDRSTYAVVADALAAVRGPTFYATLVLLLAPLPLLSIDGVAGALWTPAVLSYALAVAASTVVALTVTPVLSVLLLSRGPVRRRTNPLVVLAHRVFDGAAPAFLRRRGLVYLAVGVLIVAALAVLPQLAGGSLVPAAQDRSLLVRWQATPATSLSEMTRITAAASTDLRSIPGVRAVGAHLGRAVAGDQIVNVNSGELWVDLTDSADYDSAVATVKHTLRAYPGVHSEVLTYEQDRLTDAQTRTPDALTVRVYGTELDVLQAKAEEVRKAVSGISGVTDAKVHTQPEEPTLEVKVDLGAAEKYGIRPGEVRRAAATYFSGLAVGSLYEDQKIFDVVVWGTPDTRGNPAALNNLLIDTPAGGQVRLGDVAAVRVTPYPTVIKHEDTSRSIDVTAKVSGRGLGSVMDEARSRVANLAMPLEYRAEVLGDSVARQGAAWRTAGLALLVLIGMFLLLQAAFRSWRLATMVLLALPLALVGGVLAAWPFGALTSLGALVGLLAVFGIATRNVVLLVQSYLNAVEQEVRSVDLVLRVTRQRVGPILLTAVTLAIALIPLVLFGSVAGLEILRPLAAVMLGGLVTSTLLALFVIPALYLRFAPRVQPAEA